MPSKGLARFFPQTGHRSVQVKEPVEDTIHLRNLRVSATIGRDAWGRASRAQPIITSLQLHVDTTSAGNSDNLKDTLSYGQMYREVIGKADRASFESIDDLASSLGELFNNWPGKRVELQVLAPKASLRAEGGLTKECSWELGHSWKQCTLISHAWTIRGLKLACIIGVNPHERFEKQIVNIDLQIEGEITTAQYEAQLMGSGTAWTLLVNRICKVVEASSCETLEALCKLIAETALGEFPIPKIGVRVEKPSALPWAEGAGVEIFRDQRWLESLFVD